MTLCFIGNHIFFFFYLAMRTFVKENKFFRLFENSCGSTIKYLSPIDVLTRNVLQLKNMRLSVNFFNVVLQGTMILLFKPETMNNVFT